MENKDCRRIDQSPVLRCSFCNESEDLREHMVLADAVSGLCICDVCVKQCAKIIAEAIEKEACGKKSTGGKSQGKKSHKKRTGTVSPGTGPQHKE